MPPAGQSIIDEIEAAIGAGSDAKCLETARRVTDLFLASAGSFSDEQVELFDHVLARLIKAIERARSPTWTRGRRWPTSACSLRRSPRRRPPSSASSPEMTRSGLPHPCCRNPRALPMTIWSRSRRPRASSICSRSLPLVAEGSRHRRAAVPPLCQRQPPRCRQSRRAGVGRRFCDHRGAGGIQSRARGRGRHPRRSALGPAAAAAQPGDGSGPDKTAVARAAASVRGNPQRHCEGRGAPTAKCRGCATSPPQSALLRS